MTKLSTAFPDTMPRFDCVELKREIQAQIYQEIKNMNTEEMLDYFRQAGERADCRRAKRESENQT
jgi:hypothetical protein